jgi:hypothetical protein
MVRPTTIATNNNNAPPLPPVEEIAQAIADLSVAARKLMSTRLKDKAIVILLQAMSGNVKRSDIEIILHNLQIMDRHWLKPLEKGPTK